MIDGKRVCAVVLAAGRGKRMRSDVPKQFMELGGRPVVYYSLRAFEDSAVDDMILVTGSDDIEFCRREIVQRYHFTKVREIVSGGAERFDSVSNGLAACVNCGLVLIHDGARPMISAGLINANIECAARCGACVTAVPSKDTVKIADEEGFVRETPERSRVWIIQTPQSFHYDVIRKAYDERAARGDSAVTDDASVVEKYLHMKVKLLEGDYRNIKITTPEDIRIAATMLAERDQR